MPKGTWQAIVRRKGYAPQIRTFETRKDAKQWARLIESKIDRAVFIDSGSSERVTIRQLIDRYISEVLSGKISAGSLTRCLNFLHPSFASCTLAGL
jgi:hypothetical protein